MPVTLTYPGVYIEEIPSGVRTITGVATSVTAFIGRAKRGPVNKATTINNYGDFERIFGGLWTESKLGFAVRNFYINGGSQAIIVRLFHPNTGETSSAQVTIGEFTLEAANEGNWGKYLRGEIDLDVSEAAALSQGLTKADIFNLTITDTNEGGVTEQFRNISVKDGPRRIDQVLAAESTLVYLGWHLASSHVTSHC